jgi:hypothetical protein
MGAHQAARYLALHFDTRRSWLGFELRHTFQLGSAFFIQAAAAIALVFFRADDFGFVVSWRRFLRTFYVVYYHVELFTSFES